MTDDKIKTKEEWWLRPAGAVLVVLFLLYMTGSRAKTELPTVENAKTKFQNKTIDEVKQIFGRGPDSVSNMGRTSFWGYNYKTYDPESEKAFTRVSLMIEDGKVKSVNCLVSPLLPWYGMRGNQLKEDENE